MKSLRCLLGYHQIYKIKSFGPQDHKVGCKRCGREWAMNDRLGAMVAWDSEMEEAYRDFGDFKKLPISELKEDVDRELNQMWQECSASGKTQIEKTTDIIDFCVTVGVLTAKEAELWKLRLEKCPGHGGGQSWCAYCGDIENEFEEYPEEGEEVETS